MANKRQRLQIDVAESEEALLEVARATVIAARLPKHLRDELAAFAEDGNRKFGFDAWFDSDAKGAALIPGARLLALLAGTRRYTKAP